MVDQSLVELSLAQRMKSYEDVETKKRFPKTKPVYVRLDGRGFSKFTKRMKKPYDENMSQLMIDVTKYLVKETGAVMGYTQSDEISLVWYADENRQNIFFDGRVQKILSNVTSLCTARFLYGAMQIWPDLCERKLPTFDCRGVSMPDFGEASNMLLYRSMDAYKNSISMAAHEVFGHKKLQKVTGQQKIEMLKEAGIDFDAYPDFFKFGTFVRSEKFVVGVDDPNIPVEFRGDGTCIRSRVVEVDVGQLLDVKNRVRFIFHGEKPVKD